MMICSRSPTISSLSSDIGSFVMLQILISLLFGSRMAAGVLQLSAM